MPLLDIKIYKEVSVECALEESTAILVEQYAAFTEKPADKVINAALEHVFSRDKEFLAYLEKHPKAPDFSSLKVQINGIKPGRKSAAASGL